MAWRRPSQSKRKKWYAPRPARAAAFGVVQREGGVAERYSLAGFQIRETYSCGSKGVEIYYAVVSRQVDARNRVGEAVDFHVGLARAQHSPCGYRAYHKPGGGYYRYGNIPCCRIFHSAKVIILAECT